MSADNILETESLILDAIEAAEAVPDPLAGLVEQTATDPGAPFMPEALGALAALKQDNRAAFEALRSQLKKAGCRVTALDDAIAEENGDQGGRGPTQADLLIDLAQSVALFHTPDGSGYADLDINGHRETWPIRAKGFRRWLARRFFEETGGAPSSEALQSALNVIEAKAHFDAPERVGPYPCRRARRAALSRPRRRDMARGRDRRHRLARHRQSAGSFPPRFRHEADADARARRLDRDAALVPQCADPTPISCWWSPGRSPACAIAVPIR